MKIVSYIFIFLIIAALSVLIITQVIGLIKDIKKRRLKKKIKDTEKQEE